MDEVRKLRVFPHLVAVKSTKLKIGQTPHEMYSVCVGENRKQNQMETAHLAAMVLFLCRCVARFRAISFFKYVRLPSTLILIIWTKEF